MKPQEEHKPLGFDEQRALENLQQLQRDIQRARDDRQRTEEEFDSFVRGFRKSDAPATGPATSMPPVVEVRPPPVTVQDPERPVPEIPPRQEPPVWAGEPAPVDITPVDITPREYAPPRAEPIAEPSRLPAALLQRRPGMNPPLVIGVAAILVIVALIAVRSRRDAPAGDEAAGAPIGAAAATDAAGEQAPAGTEPTATATTADAAPQDGVNLELATLRPVWVRVTIDGRRAIERELPANQQIPLRATGSILIRAGDAGALVVRRPGRPETRLGPDGIVATREFTAAGARGATPVR